MDLFSARVVNVPIIGKSLKDLTPSLSTHNPNCQCSGPSSNQPISMEDRSPTTGLVIMLYGSFLYLLSVFLYNMFSASSFPRICMLRRISYLLGCMLSLLYLTYSPYADKYSSVCDINLNRLLSVFPVRVSVLVGFP